MIISRQLREFIGKGKHSLDTDTDADTDRDTIVAVLGCVAISIRRTRTHRRTHISIYSTISINGRWAHRKSICLMEKGGRDSLGWSWPPRIEVRA